MNSIDTERHQVHTAAGWRTLSPQLWRLFLSLHQHRGHVVPPATLFGARAPFNGSENWGRESIRLLRRRLAGSPFRVETHRCIGYELLVDDELDREAA
jgi:DNA-binding response OmpR family regulator